MAFRTRSMACSQEASNCLGRVSTRACAIAAAAFAAPVRSTPSTLVQVPARDCRASRATATWRSATDSELKLLLAQLHEQLQVPRLGVPQGLGGANQRPPLAALLLQEPDPLLEYLFQLPAHPDALFNAQPLVPHTLLEDLRLRLQDFLLRASGQGCPQPGDLALGVHQTQKLRLVLLCEPVQRLTALLQGVHEDLGDLELDRPVQPGDLVRVPLPRDQLVVEGPAQLLFLALEPEHELQHLFRHAVLDRARDGLVRLLVKRGNGPGAFALQSQDLGVGPLVCQDLVAGLLGDPALLLRDHQQARPEGLAVGLQDLGLRSSDGLQLLLELLRSRSRLDRRGRGERQLGQLASLLVPPRPVGSAPAKS
jgi:hypothetical protein